MFYSEAEMESGKRLLVLFKENFQIFLNTKCLKLLQVQFKENY